MEHDIINVFTKEFGLSINVAFDSSIRKLVAILGLVDSLPFQNASILYLLPTLLILGVTSRSCFFSGLGTAGDLCISRKYRLLSL